jgi:hypothetical protein
MQQNIAAILQQLEILNAGSTLHQIEIDLMLQHTRDLYAQLLELQQYRHQHAQPHGIVQTEIIETNLPEAELIAETPEVEIKPAELIQKLHTSTDPEPTLDDLLPQILEQAAEAHTPIPPVANMPEEFIAEILPTHHSKPTASLQAQTIIAPPEPKTEADIRKLIGINDKYQFISELFGNDKETYEIVLTRLNKLGSYADAVTWMDEVHTENRWDDEHPTVISFYDVMSQFFASR